MAVVATAALDPPVSLAVIVPGTDGTDVVAGVVMVKSNVMLDGSK